MKSLPAADIKKIGVLYPNKRFFGAMVVTVPLLMRMKELFPRAEIHAVSPVEDIRLLEGLKLIDRIVTYSLRGGLRSFWDFAGYVRREKFDLLATLRRKSERDWLVNMVSGARIKTGFTRKWSPLAYDYHLAYDKAAYRAENFLRLMSPFTDSPVKYSVPLEGAAHTQKKDVWLVPGGSSSRKKWPLQKYEALAEKILETSPYRVMFVSGPQEQGLEAQIAGRLSGWSGRIGFMTGLPVERMFGEASGCLLSVTNDCGPGHVAQTCGIPSIVLFPAGANTGEWVNAPAGSEAVVSCGPIEEIEVDTVYGRFMDKLNRIEKPLAK